ncbi:MAG: hypothetical protein L0287_34710 [Anaerolineae bacterium]|nr:hypothetical protein [Anaerolineae bacterium]
MQGKMRSHVFCTALLINNAAFSAPAVPAQILSINPTSDSVGYTTYSGTDSIDAQIGRWDTPYPYPDTGEYAPGLQPEGFSGLAIEIDVNDGGLATFRYHFKTYDAGIYDWYDIFMETPNGTRSIVSKLGKPGSQYGTYWESSTIAISESLNEFKNQRVKFVFKVMQDGWGDQSQGEVINFQLATCPIAPLTEMTDPVALDFEAGNNINTENLNDLTSAGLTCMQNRCAQIGGSMTVTSAYRPVEYQNHLREVWDTWDALRNNQDPECTDLKDDVREEYSRHGLLDSQRPAAGNPNAPHPSGNAFDARITGLPQDETVDTVASFCNMTRPWPVRDPVHYQPR